jgi:formate dehydrogenase maturation protein FdhE
VNSVSHQVAPDLWNLRAARARLLAERYDASREILLFYAGLAEWQGRMAERVKTLAGLEEFFPALLDLVRRTGPAALGQAASELDASGGWVLLDEYWERRSRHSPADFFARVLLQIYAATLTAGQECPWCQEPPQVGRLRPQGEGLALDLVCALCLRCRPFPRACCPGCDESAEANLSNLSAPDFPHLRLQACETCRGYLPLVDLSRDPQAIPEVDELAGLPLDLWAHDQGYHKLQPNLAGI